MEHISQLAFDLTEQGYVPDLIIRRGIRHLLKQRLREIRADDIGYASCTQNEFVAVLHTAPIAMVPELANQQHYEVPAAFFAEVLGPHRKYSCCLWPDGIADLADAETAALRETCVHAELRDGQRILELGCGWGSLSLWMAQHYPASRITAVSNSHSQGEYIRATARLRGLANLEVLTCDMNTFQQPAGEYDRVVSVEMFEHMRNWPRLYAQIATWLKPGGKFFKHIFVHGGVPYLFEDKDPNDWMTRHFFAGGMMPSDDLPLFCQQHLQIEARWRWDGTHYSRTANAWLANMDARREQIWPLLQQTYGDDAAQQWWSRWRMFFMACAELFGYDQGRRWWVGHYRFAKG